MLEDWSRKVCEEISLELEADSGIDVSMILDDNGYWAIQKDRSIERPEFYVEVKTSKLPERVYQGNRFNTRVSDMSNVFRTDELWEQLAKQVLPGKCEEMVVSLGAAGFTSYR